jgi:hypothetical protein
MSQMDREVIGVRIVIWAVSGCVLPCEGHISSGSVIVGAEG